MNSKSFIYEMPGAMLGIMLNVGTLLDLLREIGRYMSGSPQSRTRQRTALRELNPRLLEDIGLTREEARTGVPRPSRHHQAAAPGARPPVTMLKRALK